MIFTTFISWSIYLFLVYEYLKKKFPEKTDDVLINVSYYTIYLFSKLQIILNKRKNEVYLYLKNNETFGKYVDKTVEFVDNLIVFINKYCHSDYTRDFQKHAKNTEEDILFEFILDNRLQKSMLKQELIENLESTDINTDLLDLIDFCDFVLIRDENNNIKIINKDQITLTNLTSEDSTLYKIVPVDYKPIFCEMIVDSENMKISFSNRDDRIYNYLVVDNKFDSKFLKYFMKEHFKFILKDNADYELQIIDNNVENISIRENEILKIEENKMVKL